MKTLEHSRKIFVTFINKSYGDTKRRCCLKPDQALNDKKKSQYKEINRDIINKNEHSTFHTDKIRNYNSLKDNI